MLSSKVSNKVLTIGCPYKEPRGGIAQVLNEYSKSVYSPFKVVVNSGGNSRIEKLSKCFLGLWLLFWKCLTDKEIEIVHIHSASNNSFKRSALYVKLAKFLRKKVVIHMHGGGFMEYYKNNSQFVRSILDKTDAIIALSDFWRNYFVKELGYANVYVVENVISIPKIKEVNRDAVMHLLFLGLIDESKGIFDLLTLIAQNKEEWKNKIIFHIGGGGKIKELQKEIKENDLDSLVIYEGWVNGEKKIDLLNLCDAYILPSYYEGVPISILEAMGYGKPIIATDVGGIPEVVNDDNGILIKPGDLNQLFDAINTLLFNTELREQKGRKSLDKVNKHLPSSVSSSLQIVYNSL